MNNFSSIHLGESVVVSDPCYTIPTWCQAIVNNVLPGKYNTGVFTTDETDGWGTRCSHIVAIHEDYCGQDENIGWKRYPATIGVDSGQAGIFSKESYRIDDHPIDSEGYNFGNDFDKEPGDVWYRKMCGLTLSDQSFGSYDQGVVSSSGIGDGSYELLVATRKNKVIGFVVNFYMTDIPIKKLVSEQFLGNFFKN